MRDMRRALVATSRAWPCVRTRPRNETAPSARAAHHQAGFDSSNTSVLRCAKCSTSTRHSCGAPCAISGSPRATSKMSARRYSSSFTASWIPSNGAHRFAHGSMASACASLAITARSHAFGTKWLWPILGCKGSRSCEKQRSHGACRRSWGDCVATRLNGNRQVRCHHAECMAEFV